VGLRLHHAPYGRQAQPWTLVRPLGPRPNRLPAERTRNLYLQAVRYDSWLKRCMPSTGVFSAARYKLLVHGMYSPLKPASLRDAGFADFCF